MMDWSRRHDQQREVDDEVESRCDPGDWSREEGGTVIAHGGSCDRQRGKARSLSRKV